MADDSVTYRLEDGVAWVHMDDGKANAINGPLMDALFAAFARAEDDEAGAMVLAGRLGFFSGGLDLKTLPTLPPPELKRVLLQFGDFTARLTSFPRPVVALSAGHALAGGAVMLLTADWRLGCEGAFKYGLNEVAISLPMPTMIVELARAMLDPRWFHRSVAHGEVYDPEGALRAGFLDELRPPQELFEAAAEAARRLAVLPEPAYSQTKARLRRPILAAAERGELEAELGQYFTAMGLGPLAGR